MPRYLRVLLGYTVLALVLTWPLIARFATHVPGDGIDDPSLAWNLWWVKHALVDQPQNPFASGWQFWPIGINLAFYTLTVLNGMLSIPIQVVFGLIPAYNVMLLLSFVLSGLGGYLLAAEFLRGSGGTPWSGFAAFIAGALYAFASASCSTPRSVRAISPARSGRRSQRSTSGEPPERRAGARCGSRRCSSCCRRTPS